MAQAQHREPWKALSPGIIVTGVAPGLWFWTQSLIGARALSSAGIGDGLHSLTAGLSLYLQTSPTQANVLLIVSSAIIDALGLFLLGRWLFLGSVRPFLGLLGLRQRMQALCALPCAAEHDLALSEIPSLLVTYNVAHDYFFSGHTAIAVFGAIELARFGKNWLTAVAVALFEIAAVIVLRAHYTMDVFTGFVAALWMATVCDAVAPAIDGRLSDFRTN